MAAREHVALRVGSAALRRFDDLAVEFGVTRSLVLREALAAGEPLVGERLRKRKARDEAEERSP